MKTKITFGVVGLAVAGAVFWGGMKYGQARVVMPGNGTRLAQFGANGQMMERNGGTNLAGNRQGGARDAGFLTGEILSKDEKSITVKLAYGSSKIVFTSASTTVSKMSSGTMADLSVGTGVMIQGTTNSDGSLTAQFVQIRPAESPIPGGVR